MYCHAVGGRSRRLEKISCANHKWSGGRVVAAISGLGGPVVAAISGLGGPVVAAISGLGGPVVAAISGPGDQL